MNQSSSLPSLFRYNFRWWKIHHQWCNHLYVCQCICHFNQHSVVECQLILQKLLVFTAIHQQKFINRLISKSPEKLKNHDQFLFKWWPTLLGPENDGLFKYDFDEVSIRNYSWWETFASTHRRAIILALHVSCSKKLRNPHSSIVYAMYAVLNLIWWKCRYSLLSISEYFCGHYFCTLITQLGTTITFFQHL